VSKAVLNSSVIIALSTLGYLNKLKQIFTEVLIVRAVHDEICVRGHYTSSSKYTPNLRLNHQSFYTSALHLGTTLFVPLGGAESK